MSPVCATCTFFFGCTAGEACVTLVPPPGVEPGPSAVKAQSPNHWTARTVFFFIVVKYT